MGRYMRTTKSSDDVAVLAVNQPVGVSTRAKTRALQRSLRSSSGADDDSCYLQLRSRRLVKVSPMKSRAQSSGPRKKSGCSENTATCDSDVEKFAGDGKIEPSERSTRESTPVTPPCSIIRDVPAPWSPRKPRPSSARVSAKSENAVDSCKTKLEESFAKDFAARESEMRRDFMERYNFDILTEEPLPGRYEWEKIDN